MRGVAATADVPRAESCLRAAVMGAMCTPLPLTYADHGRTEQPETGTPTTPSWFSTTLFFMLFTGVTSVLFRAATVDPQRC